jgi:hypothetical protein
MPKTARQRGMSIAALVTAVGSTFAAPAHADNDVQQDCAAEPWSQLRKCLRRYEVLLSGRPLDVGVERIGLEHAGE